MDTMVYDAPILDVGPRGPFVLAGTYEIEVEAGGNRQATSVEVRADPLLDIIPDEQRRRYEFTLELYDLQAREYHAAVQGNLISRSAIEALDTLETRDDVDEGSLEVADSLRDEITDASRAIIRENGLLRGWWRGLIGEFDGGPSTQGTMTGPTDDQLRRLAHAQSDFARAVEELDRVLLEVVPALNEILRELDVPEIVIVRRGNLVS
jgi:hypothetical protein